jgi:hypothetical protein
MATTSREATSVMRRAATADGFEIASQKPRAPPSAERQATAASGRRTMRLR